MEQPPTVLSLAGESLFLAGCPEESVALLRQAQLRYPAAFWINHDLAFALADRGPSGIAGAVGYYRAALALRPGSAGVHANLGSALKAQGDVAGAIACYRKAIELDPKSAAAHTNLGVVLQEQDDPAGAVACQRKAIEFDPMNAAAYCNLGVALREQGEFAASLEAFQTGHELGSKRKDWNHPSEQLVKQAKRRVELEAQLSDILDGRRKPADAAERIDLADVCRCKKLYAASARFYTEAFA